MAITRITARWDGFTGSPGYSNFYFQGALDPAGVQTARIRVQAFFEAFQAFIPNDASVAIESEAGIIEEGSAVLTGYASGTEPLNVVTGAGSGGYSGASGAVVNWLTDTVRSGRRMQGRTFLVPLSGNAYDSGGSLSTIALTGIRNGAALLTPGPDGNGLVVWGRPSADGGGIAAPVTGYRVPDMAAVLRSRRD